MDIHLKLTEYEYACTTNGSFVHAYSYFGWIFRKKPLDKTVPYRIKRFENIVQIIQSEIIFMSSVVISDFLHGISLIFLGKAKLLFGTFLFFPGDVKYYYIRRTSHRREILLMYQFLIVK
jgi:hypothetical protein